MKINEKIRSERIKSNLSQEMLAEALNVTRVTVSKWERGEVKPSITNIKKIERYFGIKLVDGNFSKDNMLTIGTTHIIADFKLEEITSKFEENNPDIIINVRTDDADKINEMLINDQIDILIDYYPQINFSNNRYIFKAIGQFNTCFACNDKLYEEIKNIHKLKDLNNYKLIIPGDSRRRQLLDNFLKEEDIVLKYRSLAHNTKYMADKVLKRDYIGYFIEEQVEYYNLKKVNLVEKLPINPIGIVYLKNASAKINEFIDLICKYF